MNIAYNADCVEIMRRYPDGYFDLAVVDPVYGDVRQGGYMNGSGGGLAKQKNYHAAIWKQKKTPPEYFQELFRVSKNQIIWGGNYFVEEIARNSPCWIVWNKDHPDGVNYADCELAWTSFTCSAKLLTYRWNGFVQQNMKNKEVRIHPTQKPTDLYRWIYRKFDIPPGSKIIDTHLGSGTNRRAAYDFGLDFVGCEVDKTYFDLQEQAFEEYTSQISLFDRRSPMAQKNATPTAEQTKVLANNGLRPDTWTVVKDLQYSMIVHNRITGEFRVVNK